jgi:hypothetical protein
VQLVNLESWIRRTLTRNDSVVIEMTTNNWQVYDELLAHIHSETVAHPPHVALITCAQVITDKIAASHLARLHAKGYLPASGSRPRKCATGAPSSLLPGNC